MGDPAFSLPERYFNEIQENVFLTLGNPQSFIGSPLSN